MINNMMNLYSQIGGMETPDPLNGVNSFQGGMSDIEQALMMQNLDNYQGNNMTGPMMGMPGRTQEVDEMQASGNNAMDMFKSLSQGQGDDGSSIAGNMAQLAMLFMSDRRLKKNIERLGKHKGVNIYKYDYLWDEDGTGRYGVMADEVPHAALEHESGFMMVDYSRIF